MNTKKIAARDRFQICEKKKQKIPNFVYNSTKWKKKLIKIVRFFYTTNLMIGCLIISTKFHKLIEKDGKKEWKTSF